MICNFTFYFICDESFERLSRYIKNLFFCTNKPISQIYENVQNPSKSKWLDAFEANHPNFERATAMRTHFRS